VLRIKFSAGRQFSTSKSASSPSAKPLYAIINDTKTGHNERPKRKERVYIRRNKKT